MGNNHQKLIKRPLLFDGQMPDNCIGLNWKDDLSVYLNFRTDNTHDSQIQSCLLYKFLYNIYQEKGLLVHEDCLDKINTLYNFLINNLQNEEVESNTYNVYYQSINDEPAKNFIITSLKSINTTNFDFTLQNIYNSEAMKLKQCFSLTDEEFESLDMSELNQKIINNFVINNNTKKDIFIIWALLNN